MSQETILDELKKPFHPKEIHWRIGKKSKAGDKATALAYINARDAMKRLDDVLGIDGWQDKYEETPKGRLICSLSLRINGEWITKSDGAGETQFEGEKGAMSDAFKRAAVKFGVGRYLYYLDTQYYPIDNFGQFKVTPPLPAWATPEGYSSETSYMALVREHFDEIAAIKEAIANDDIETARAAYQDIESEKADILWKAPSKGGIFTTEERQRLQEGK